MPQHDTSRSIRHRLFGRRRDVALVLGLVLGQWGLTVSGAGSLLVLLLLSGAAWSAWKRRWGGVLVLVMASPLAFGFLGGILTYGRDDAYVLTHGLRGSEGAFIDPVTRLPIATSGCLVDGSEWMREVPYNLGLRFMTALLGPGPGTYSGPIPTEDEARRAVQSGSPLDWRALATDVVNVGRHEVRLQRWLGPALVDAYYSFDPLRDDPDSVLAPDGRIRATLWHDRVLLIEMTSRYATLFEGGRAHVSAVDAESGRLLGHFAGSCSGHSFPLPWRPVGPRLLDMDYREGPPALVPRSASR